MIIKLLNEHNFKFVSLRGGCRGSYESTFVKMPHCWKPYVTAHFTIIVRMPQTPVTRGKREHGSFGVSCPSCIQAKITKGEVDMSLAFSKNEETLDKMMQLLER